jgi:hypothetical protein
MAFYSFDTIKGLLEKHAIDYREDKYGVLFSNVNLVPDTVWKGLYDNELYGDMASHNGFLIWLLFSARSNFITITEILKMLDLSPERYYHFMNDILQYRLKADSEALKYIYEEVFDWIPFVDFYRFKKIDLEKLGIVPPRVLLPRFYNESSKSGVRISFVQTPVNVGTAYDVASSTFKKTNRYSVFKLGVSSIGISIGQVSNNGPVMRPEDDADLM